LLKNKSEVLDKILESNPKVTQSNPKVTQNNPKVTRLKCKYCIKEYKYKQGKWRHEKSCKYKDKQLEVINNNTNNIIKN
jgi:hypothetical protein